MSLLAEAGGMLNVIYFVNDFVTMIKAGFSLFKKPLDNLL
jgi:hypothetical protein